MAHVTITDKDRGPDGDIAPGNAIGLLEDEDWHWFSIRDDRDGEIKRGIIVPDGTYLLLVALHGNIITLGASDLEVNAVRYHFKSSVTNPTGKDGEFDQGGVGQKYHDSTAWSTISMARRVKSTWFDTFDAKIVVKAGSTDPEHAHAVGIDYRIGPGKYNRDNLILKFIDVS